MSNAKKVEKIKKSASKERSQKIASEMWMPRGAVYNDKRKKERDNSKHKGNLLDD